jgi:hypothetical protein
MLFLTICMFISVVFSVVTIGYGTGVVISLVKSKKHILEIRERSMIFLMVMSALLLFIIILELTSPSPNAIVAIIVCIGQLALMIPVVLSGRKATFELRSTH